MILRHRSTILLGLTSVVLLGAFTSAQQPSLPPPFPRTNATRLLENDRIVIWDIVWPNGQPTALHRHIYDQVGTYYARGGRTITSPEGVAREAMTEVGSLSTTRKGTTHIEMGNTDPPLRAVFIELKQEKPSGVAPSSGAEAPAFPRPQATERSNDERVTVWEFAPVTGAVHAYRAGADLVVVYLGDGRLQVSEGGGEARTVPVKPGTMRFVPRGTSVRETMLEGTPRAIAFEVK